MAGAGFLFAPALTLRNMIYDVRSSCGDADSCRVHAASAVFRLWWPYCLFALFCLCACGSLSAAEIPNPPVTPEKWGFASPVPSGELIRGCSVWVDMKVLARDLINPSGVRISINAGQRVRIYSWDSANGYYGFFSQIGYSGNSSSSGIKNWKIPEKIATWKVVVKGTNTEVGTFEIKLPEQEVSVAWVASGTVAWLVRKVDDIEVIFTDSGSWLVINPNLPKEPENKELTLALMNNTLNDITIPWGNTSMTLKPGMNLFRYDGPVGADGMPVVCPPGFRGSATIGSDGRSYVGGIIGKEPGGEFPYWMDPPVYPPTPPGTSPQWDIQPPIAPNGPRVKITKPGGNIDISQFPPLPPSGPSQNPPGGGAVISDPTLPSPLPTPGNTISNVTNTTNTTIITTNNYGDSKDKDNSAAANAIVPDSTVPPDPAGKPSDAGAAADGLVGSVKGKFSSDSFRLLSQGAIPKIMNFSVSIPCGTLGTFTGNIDFSKSPFPMIRMALVAMLTIAFGVAFMKRVTI